MSMSTVETPVVEATVAVHTSCRVCGGALTQVLDLGEQRLAEFLDAPGRFSHPAVPLTLAICQAEDCKLVQLTHTAPREWLYEKYWYRSGLNESMVRALADVTDRARELVELTDRDYVMDIGANDGTLLAQYNLPLYFQRGDHELTPSAPCPQRIAVDPAKNLADELSRSCEIVIPDYFPPKKYDGPKPKVITSIAMFYDLEDPNTFVAEVKRILHPEGVWILQLGDLLGMFRSNGFDAICHEHLEYYSMTALVNLLRRHDLVIFDAERNDVNGGSLRAYVKHAATHPQPGSAVQAMIEEEKRFAIDDPATFAALAQVIEGVKIFVLRTLEEHGWADGGCDLYGASTKGNTLIQTFGIGPGQVGCAWERSREKWGKFTTTGVEIVSEAVGRGSRAKLLLVLPWHFRDSILEREREFLAAGGRILFPLPTPALF